ncbi:hypothetical protein LJR296_003363 [Cupriavidus necator]
MVRTNLFPSTTSAFYDIEPVIFGALVTEGSAATGKIAAEA